MRLTRRQLLRTAAPALPALALPAFASAYAPASDDALPAAIAAIGPRTANAQPISAAERQQRADKARRLLAQHRAGALVITGGTSLAYFTGIHTGQSERLFAWVLPARSAPYIVCPAFEETRMQEQLKDLPDGAQTRIYTWQEDQDPYRLLAAHLPPGPIAIDERVQFVFAQSIAQAASAHPVVSGIPIVSGCRAIKSPAELALLQLANDITLEVYRAAWLSAGPGTSTARFEQLVSLGYTRAGVQGEVSCQVGAYSALPHGSLTPQVIRENQVVLIDDGCSVHGYQSDISRSFVYGTPTDKQRQVFDIVHRAQAAALAAAQPGVSCQAIDDAARKIIADAGYGPGYRTFTHRVGHGIGMDGHEWPYLVAGNTTPLEVGMCFSDEPGIYLPTPAASPGSSIAPTPATPDLDHFGIRLEDDWHLTESGGTFFTQPSPSLEKPFG